ncbi:MAG: hypothetical protein ACFWTS_03490 [Pseudoclavibacter caeni]|jgi:hypothetical protein
MRKSADHRVARHAFAPALPAPPVRRHDTTLDHRPIRLQPLPDGLETEFVQTAERGEIGRNKSRVGHVEVFRMGSVRTSILKETSTPTRLATRSTTYTLVHEEPDSPQPLPVCQSLSPRVILTAVGRTFATPATRLGMWTHAMTASTVFTFALMWGVPFSMAIGLERAQASTALVIITLVGIVAGPVIGALTGSYLHGRTWLAFGFGVMALLGWVILLLPISLPVWLFFTATVLLGVGNPASAVCSTSWRIPPGGTSTTRSRSAPRCC